MACLHLVFNVVKLLPALEDPFPGQKVKPPLPPEIVDREEHYEVERILDSHFTCDQLHFLVKWKGYSDEENSWIPEEDLAAPARLREFYATHLGTPWRVHSVAFQSLSFHASRMQHPRRVGDIRG